MKSFIIQIDERNESILLEILRRFDAVIKPILQNSEPQSQILNPVLPKTVGHFLEVSNSLRPWSDEDLDNIEKFHNQLNEYKPPTW